jgi:hypothetical protein
MRGSAPANINISIIAVPAIGAHPEQTWKAEGSQTSWITDTQPLDQIQPRGPKIPTLRDMIRDKIQSARVMIYSHGKPKDGDDLDVLAKKLLDTVISERKGDVRYMS